MATDAPKPITEQCAERGEIVPVGSTAGEVRARGYEVHPAVPDDAVLERDDGTALLVGTGTVGRRTGYFWRSSRGMRALDELRAAGAVRDVDLEDYLRERHRRREKVGAN